MEEEDTREQEVLRERISQLESDVEDYGKMLETWRERFNEMQIAYGRERQLREQVETEAEKLRGVLRGGTEPVVLPSGRDRRSQYASKQAEEDPKVYGPGEGNEVGEEASMTCGKCSIDTRCQCIEEAFDMGNIVDDAVAPAFKRPHSPQSAIDNKRVRQNPDDGDITEIDFTSQFAIRRPPTFTTSSSTASSAIPVIAPPDPCGFCSDETPCICAEMAKECARHDQDTKPMPLLPPAVKHKLTNGSTASDPCANGPGTCAQCLSNPTSALFCKSVAANRCSSFSSATPTDPNSAPPSTSLTCADAFTTLSQHPAFPAATEEYNTWIPQLTAIPKASDVPERTAFDIEAASVMAVLKLFDRRFGSQGDSISVNGS